ncbi:hypothetical protein RJ641_019685 [Dillenia turbinata]|uniref:Uncharacterized protein n=1 Tax=Dillenia turbinata TaxID=194707 RepID=A0AAN8UMG0_9MAGN
MALVIIRSIVVSKDGVTLLNCLAYNTNELKTQSNPGIKNTVLQLSGLERSKLELLAPKVRAMIKKLASTSSIRSPHHNTCIPWGNVYVFTAKPALPNAKNPRTTEEHKTAPPGVLTELPPFSSFILEFPLIGNNGSPKPAAAAFGCSA